jgi:membrane protein required for colicin V production
MLYPYCQDPCYLKVCNRFAVYARMHERGSMNWFDIILIIALALTTLLGIWRGLISMVLPLIGLIIGIIVAGQHYGTVGGWLPIDNPEHAKWAAYAIIILVFLIVFGILAFSLSRFIKWTPLGWVNRLGGGIFGFATGALFLAAILAACVKFEFGEGIIHGSGIAQLLLDWLPVVLGLLPGEFDAVQEFFQ